jgi:hypothetical protein
MRPYGFNRFVRSFAKAAQDDPAASEDLGRMHHIQELAQHLPRFLGLF